MTEIWKDIPGYEGLYQVSNTGKIRNATGHIKVPFLSHNGYNRIELCKSGTSKKYFVHRLVYLTFKGTFNLSLDINHIDGIKLNNIPENLETVTRQDHHKRTADQGLHPKGDNYWTDNRKTAIENRIKDSKHKGTNAGTVILNEVQVREIRKLREAGVKQHVIAQQFNVARTTISAVVNGYTWAHLK